MLQENLTLEIEIFGAIHFLLFSCKLWMFQKFLISLGDKLPQFWYEIHFKINSLFPSYSFHIAIFKHSSTQTLTHHFNHFLWFTSNFTLAYYSSVGEELFLVANEKYAFISMVILKFHMSHCQNLGNSFLKMPSPQNFQVICMNHLKSLKIAFFSMVILKFLLNHFEKKIPNFWLFSIFPNIMSMSQIFT